MHHRIHWISICVYIITTLVMPVSTYAQNVTSIQKYEGVITRISSPTNDSNQIVAVKILTGPREGDVIDIAHKSTLLGNTFPYAEHERVYIATRRNVEGAEVYYIADVIRTDSLMLLAMLFVCVILVITRKKGLMSLFGMLGSFAIVFWGIIPRILAGSAPVPTALVGAVGIIVLTFYISHGFNVKTSIAVLSTSVTLICTGILAHIFVYLTKLTGFASEEASFLQLAYGGELNMRGLVLAGMIISVLGVLDDITISQAAIVFQLKKANHSLSFLQLYARAMEVGTDHIASLVNTLILVYTGAALPLMLLFMNSSANFFEIINSEIIAEEIVRTLVGSTGIVLAVPVTTIIAAWWAASHKLSQTPTHIH